LKGVFLEKPQTACWGGCRYKSQVESSSPVNHPKHVQENFDAWAKNKKGSANAEPFLKENF